jgi:hypothetical protein
VAKAFGARQSVLSRTGPRLGAPPTRGTRLGRGLTGVQTGSPGGHHQREAVALWSLTSLREKLIKIGAKVVHHARYAVFQMAEVAVPKELFEKILCLIDRLRPRPAPA